jgi:AraC-like DNA-binding protein
MNLASYSLVQCSYFFLLLFSIIVLLDVLIRFKSPIKLKVFFLLFVLSILVYSFCSFLSLAPDEYVLVRMTCAMIVGTSLVQIFTNLYFIQHKRIANIYVIAAYTIYILLIIYVQVVGYDKVFPKLNSIKNTTAQVANSVNLPMYLDFFLELDFIVFNLFCLYYIYNILFKFSFKNIYFKKIKIWTFCFFMVIVSQLFIILFSLLFAVPNDLKMYVHIVYGLVLLLIILYRPNFINKNGSKISFGFLFNISDYSSDIKQVDFNFHFYTNFYYKSKSANLEEFSNLLGVSKDLLFKYVYFNYSMSFEELLNKSRVEYFVEIIKEPQFKNYTVEALALEVGFSSRQRFYQPFKKYHGGNPSDLIDILNE